MVVVVFAGRALAQMHGRIHEHAIFVGHTCPSGFKYGVRLYRCYADVLPYYLRASGNLGARAKRDPLIPIPSSTTSSMTDILNVGSSSHRQGFQALEYRQPPVGKTRRSF